jgi:hypothetical protein
MSCLNDVIIYCPQSNSSNDALIFLDFNEIEEEMRPSFINCEFFDIRLSLRDRLDRTLRQIKLVFPGNYTRYSQSMFSTEALTLLNDPNLVYKIVRANRYAIGNCCNILLIQTDFYTEELDEEPLELNTPMHQREITTVETFGLHLNTNVQMTSLPALHPSQGSSDVHMSIQPLNSSWRQSYRRPTVSIDDTTFDQ